MPTYTQYENAFCENGECRVVLFRKEVGKKQGCPDCGEYGRTKGTDKSPEPLPVESTAEVPD